MEGVLFLFWRIWCSLQRLRAQRLVQLARCLQPPHPPQKDAWLELGAVIDSVTAGEGGGVLWGWGGCTGVGNKGWTPCGCKTKKHRMDFPHFLWTSEAQIVGEKGKSVWFGLIQLPRSCAKSKNVWLYGMWREIVEQTLQDRTSVLIDRKGFHIFLLLATVRVLRSGHGAGLDSSSCCFTDTMLLLSTLKLFAFVWLLSVFIQVRDASYRFTP